MTMNWIDEFLSSRGYDPVRTDDVEKESDDSRAANQHHTPSEPRKHVSVLMWLLPYLSTAVFAVISLILLVELHRRPQLGTYENDFSTDLHFASPIPLQKVRFRGTPHFYNNGTPWAEPIEKMASWPQNLQYVGQPSPEVDRDWQRLIGQRYFSLSEEEAQRAWGQRRHEFVDQNAGGYTAGLDMFHTLHCLNELRKSVHPEYYFPDGRIPRSAAFHNDHCIEILRQTIQCYGSTTLIPTKYIDGIEHNYIDSDQEHVCRSFSFLRDYTSSRTRGGEHYVPRDQSSVDKTKQALAQAWGAKYGDNERSGGHVG